jgi:hypothetical protein
MGFAVGWNVNAPFLKFQRFQSNLIDRTGTPRLLLSALRSLQHPLL